MLFDRGDLILTNIKQQVYILLKHVISLNVKAEVITAPNLRRLIVPNKGYAFLG